ncbi:LacI family transcriptional regulator [Actinosynnema sp. ALI-1.44]|uniref:LacI family DNA-binding transcriptional regulator n=1 Tax=Actinosynnema sp. ALI-1.44 TaxID=1933779 RepID=UPI00097BADA2|nr:LacI family DNA-binding transcriptional regulator [Actinosynnema sp. ALI-1.44]ONI81272.1 LacI family transcriptional regulator [Actinosynnema sp. ALI-1.44]
MRRATIGDVAARAGVSTATVSRVINGGVVSGATAAKVWAAVDGLGYSPNALTKSIFAGRASTIGVVIRDLSSPFYLDLIRGVDEVAAADGSLVMLGNTYRMHDREAAQVRAMDEQRVRGLIVTTGEAADPHARRMAENGTPCVIVSRTVPGMHSISLDNVAAGQLMAAHLTACGRSSVGVITAGDRPAQNERVEGLRRGMPGTVPASAENDAEAAAAVGALLASNPKLDAIACMSSRLTVAVHTALTASGLSIPDDVAFLTMDDFPWAAALGITVVVQPTYEMGRKAAELVVDPVDEPAAVVFEPALAVRTSCGEVSAPDREPADLSPRRTGHTE